MSWPCKPIYRLTFIFQADTRRQRHNKLDSDNRTAPKATSNTLWDTLDTVGQQTPEHNLNAVTALPQFIDTSISTTMGLTRGSIVFFGGDGQSPFHFEGPKYSKATQTPPIPNTVSHLDMSKHPPPPPPPVYKYSTSSEP